MKELDKLEAQFREETDEHKPTPPAFIWDEINRELPKEKKNRRRAYFWIFMGLSICIFIILQKDRFISTHHDINSLSIPNKASVNQHSKENRHEKIIDQEATNTFSNASEIINTDNSKPIKQTNQVHIDLYHSASVDTAYIAPRTEKRIIEKTTMHSTALRLDDGSSLIGTETDNFNVQNETSYQSTSITKVSEVKSQNVVHEDISSNHINLQVQH